jgi:hypothetical protein
MKDNLINYVKKSKNGVTSFNEVKMAFFKNKVFYGVGANTLRTIAVSNIDIDLISYFCDKNPIFHGRYVSNKLIKSPLELIKDINTPDVIIFSPLYFNDIKSELLRQGFKGNIFSFFQL